MKFLRIIKLYHVVDQCDSGSDLEELIKWELICFYWNNKTEDFNDEFWKEWDVIRN